MCVLLAALVFCAVVVIRYLSDEVTNLGNRDEIQSNGTAR